MFPGGESISAPYVSGLAAILRGIPGIGSPDAIAYDMESTALDLGLPGRDELYGYGLIQMDAAIRIALPPTPTVTPTRVSMPVGGHVNYPPYGGGYASPTPTLTPTASSTASPTPTSTATLMAGTPTVSAAVGAMSVARLDPSVYRRLTSDLGNDWPLGCGISLMILLGLWQVWLLSHRRGNRMASQRYLKMRQ